MKLYPQKVILFLALFLFILTATCSNSDNKNPLDEMSEEQQDPPADSDSDGGGEDGSDGGNPTNSSSIVEQYGQLRIDGNKVVNKDGEAIQLRGMSFFWSQWIGKYYTEETVKWLKDDWQCTVVRAAMAVDEDQGYITNPDTEKQKVFTVIDAAIEQGIYVIVDWHSHHAENYTAQAKEFFGEVAQKYGDKPNIIYEPYNEPIDSQWNSTIKPYHEEVLTEIRKHDPDNIVICGTRLWSQRVDEVIGNRIDDPNVAYTLHYYAATHNQDLRNIAKQAIDAGIPIFVTEYGLSEASGNGSLNPEESIVWWEFLDDHKISHCNWSIADKEELSAALKPGASDKGGWPESMITESGKMVRDELKAKNPNFGN